MKKRGRPTKRERIQAVDTNPLYIALRDRGWTQRELAERTGLTEDTVSRALKRRSDSTRGGSLDTYRRLCRELEVPLAMVVQQRPLEVCAKEMCVH